MDPDALLADLDDDQRRAVTCESTLVAVIAGAGSGKTRVLTRRVAHRIATGSADAAHTVVLTFTREAASELRRRLHHLGLTQRVTAGTFHSVANGLLRQRWIDRDEQPRTVTNDRLRIVRELVGRSAATTNLDELVAEMNWATARGLGPETYVSAVRHDGHRAGVAPELVADTLDAYITEKRRRRVVDLDDLLAGTNEALARDVEFATATRWRFRHVLVDEAQDLNPLQQQLVDHLRTGHDDLFLVGDPAQAIYGFNGSDPATLTDVSDRFPGIEVVRLPANHRSTPQIVDAGAFALRSSGQATDVVSARGDGPPVTVAAHDDEAAEAAAVASAVARLDPSIVRSARVAVLARTHAALVAVRKAMGDVGVPVRRPIDGPGSPIGSLLADAYRTKESDRLRRWAHDLSERSDEMPSDGTDPGADVAGAVLDFLSEQPIGAGADFRAWVVANDPFDRHAAGVELLTFHAAKGREWHSVHLIGVESSLVPHRSATTAAARAEEARMLYVALTRATDDLTVHSARRRAGYRRKPTPFLDGFDSVVAPAVPPPNELVSMRRSPRLDTLDRLHEWRSAAARAGGVVPDAICTDRALAQIAEHRPASPDELDSITGLGPITSRRLFDRIHAVLTG